MSDHIPPTQVPPVSTTDPLASRSLWVDALVRAASETILRRTNVHVVHNAGSAELRKQKPK